MAVDQVNGTRSPELALQLSMGIESCTAGDGKTLAQLVSRADAAMYVAKRRAR